MEILINVMYYSIIKSYLSQFILTITIIVFLNYIGLMLIPQNLFIGFFLIVLGFTFFIYFIVRQFSTKFDSEKSR